LWLLLAGCHFGLRHECDTDRDCPRGSVCELHVDTTRCNALPIPPAMNPLGGACRASQQCESAHCENDRFCDAATCNGVADCPAGFVCAPVTPVPASSMSRCVRRPGDPCLSDAICLGGSCHDGICACGPPEALCLAASDCCRGSCYDGRCLVHAVDAGGPSDSGSE
jgi:hypothetical protein